MQIDGYPKRDGWQTLARVCCLLVWFVVIIMPLGWLYLTLSTGDLPRAEDLSYGRYIALLGRTVALGAILASVSVAAAWPAGRLIGGNAWARKWGIVFLVIPLLVPPQIQFYAWGLPALPTSRLGAILSESESLTMLASFARSLGALGLWYWPLCAIILGVGWQRTDPDVWSQARLEADTLRRWWWIGLPMLRNAMVLAWVLVFVLVQSQFAVFHLAAVDTVGTELSSLYQLTGSVHTVAWAAAPLVIPAAGAALLVDRFLQPVSQTFDLPANEPCWFGHWVISAVLWAFSALAPVVLLAANVQGWRDFVLLGQLSWDALLYSFGVAVIAGGLAILIGLGILLYSQAGRGRVASVMRWTTVLTALLPGSLVASAMVFTFNRNLLSELIYQQLWMVSIGHAALLGILAVLVLSWARSSLPASLSDLAKLDGAEGIRGLLSVWLPGSWPAMAAAMLLAVTLSITELSATLVLLPPGVPNFAQQLLNQMHYARDQQVIASSLLLILFAGAVSLAVFAMTRLSRLRLIRSSIPVILLCCLAGCDDSGIGRAEVRVVSQFGMTGRGPGQFIYPRAITMAPDNTFFVVDKSARVQHLTEDGKSLGEWTMPEFLSGKPIGLYCSPDKKVYVADTHYHRVMIYGFDGKLLKQFGSFGKEPGQFIYPTDIDIAPDGRIFVSEYGGNDRISVFSADGRFLRSFGSLGDGDEQFSRPSAICIDSGRRILHVADSCNHRIVLYDLEGKRIRAFGTPGELPGQMRYPYDVNLLSDGSLVVAEYGNNRIQRFSPEGKSLGVWGQPGREPGQVLYPWGVVVDSRGLFVVVDSGNNRIQVWKAI